MKVPTVLLSQLIVPIIVSIVGVIVSSAIAAYVGAKKGQLETALHLQRIDDHLAAQDKDHTHLSQVVSDHMTDDKEEFRFIRQALINLRKAG